jgi:ABC-2 type transport system permease protein
MQPILNHVISVWNLILRDFAVMDKTFIIVYQIGFSVIYIIVASYTLKGYLSEEYPIYVTIGMIISNAAHGASLAGILIYEDRKNGMFTQLMLLPFSRADYICAIIITISITSIASSIGLFFIFGPIFDFEFFLAFIQSPMALGKLIYSVIITNIFFAAVAIIFATKIENNNLFNGVLNTVFNALILLSSAIFPTALLTGFLKIIFMLNPFEYFLLIGRGGGSLDVVISITLITALIFCISIKYITKMELES